MGSKGIHPSLGPSSPWRWQETQEEEREIGRVEILPCGRQWQNPPFKTRVSCRRVWRRDLHGRPFRPSVLRKMWLDLYVQCYGGQVNKEKSVLVKKKKPDWKKKKKKKKKK